MAFITDNKELRKTIKLKKTVPCTVPRNKFYYLREAKFPRYGRSKFLSQKSKNKG